MRSLYVALILSFAMLTGCNSGNGTGAGKADSTKVQSKAAPTPPESALNKEGTDRLLRLISDYYFLKNALVATKGDLANNMASALASETINFQTLVRDDAASAPLRPYLDTVRDQSKLIAATKDETCERQRLAFGTLSSAMYGLLKKAGLRNATVYQEYCPMAYNEKGAHWLSDDSDIKNPYFGKKMLECGEVTDVIK